MKNLTNIAIYIVGITLMLMGIMIAGMVLTTDENTDVNKVVASQPQGLDANVLWSEINVWRINQGYKPYRLNQDLCDYGKVRIEEVKTDWSHNGFWKHETEVYNDLHYTYLGENLARDFSEEFQALNGWLNSPTHRANLDFPYTDSCVVTSGGFAVQTFASF